MTTETTTLVLTPAQFVAARALARAYGHLWSSVPDHTYNIDAIRAIAHEWQHSMLPAGIECPHTEMEGGRWLNVIHTTGSGRLHWIVRENGNVRLEIYRPAAFSDIGVCVARVWLINDDDQCYQPSDDFGFSTSEDGISDDLLFERHVHALIRPLVALLTANAPERAEGEDYEQWKQQYIRPAVEKAKSWLAPLFEQALPDPSFFLSYTDDDRRRYEEQYGTIPETYWTRPDERDSSYDESRCMYVVHRNERFPVESEKTAVHAVLLLQQHAEMPLIEAIRAAVESDSYRPK